MINGLIDIGGQNGFGGYVGGGAGYADIHEVRKQQRQISLAADRRCLHGRSANIDIGLKYRYFDGGRTSRTATFDFTPGTVTCGTVPCSGGTASFGTIGHYRSHSLLASLVYNFARCGGCSAAASASASASASAASCAGDADVPGRIGDPGDEHLSGASAAASAAGSCRARRTRQVALLG